MALSIDDRRVGNQVKILLGGCPSAATRQGFKSFASIAIVVAPEMVEFAHILEFDVALVTEKMIFLHIPKAGGQFFRHAVKACNIPHIEVGEQHDHFPELYKYKPPEFFAGKKIIAFVRHPLSWYQSRWAFRLKNGWSPRHPLDYNCYSNDFPTFVNNVLRYKPDGWFTWECRMFLDTIGKPPDFVGRVENLVEDTIHALQFANKNYGEKAIRALPRINDSDLDGRPSMYWARYTETLARRVIAVEREVIGRYYSNFRLDIEDFCGAAPY